MKTNTLNFSGHETFHCKHIWLKKGYDFLSEGQNSFKDEDAIVKLGVGRNMVQSIRYWLEAFGITRDHILEGKFAEKVFSDEGFDPFLNDIGSLWLLHYYLVTTGKASIYNLFFNTYRKQRLEFSPTHLKRFLISQIDNKLSEKIIDRDINVFIRNYLPPSRKSKNPDDDYSNLFNDLHLLERIDKDRSNKHNWYRTENTERKSLPHQIVLFSILDRYGGKDTLSFFELLNGHNSPGVVFALNADGLMQKLDEIVESNSQVLFKEDADIKTLQFRTKMNPWIVLKNYYE